MPSNSVSSPFFLHLPFARSWGIIEWFFLIVACFWWRLAPNHDIEWIYTVHANSIEIQFWKIDGQTAMILSNIRIKMYYGRNQTKYLSHLQTSGVADDYNKEQLEFSNGIHVISNVNEVKKSINAVYTSHRSPISHIEIFRLNILLKWASFG